MNEFKFCLSTQESDSSQFVLPMTANVVERSLTKAAEQFAKQHNLTVHAVDDVSVWFVHRKDGSVHRYLV